MTRLASPAFTALQREIESRESCQLDVTAVGGVDADLAHFKIYVDGTIRVTPPRLRSLRATTREVIPVEPDEHRVQVRDAGVTAPGRRESNVLCLRMEAGERVALGVRVRDGQLHVDVAE